VGHRRCKRTKDAVAGRGRADGGEFPPVPDSNQCSNWNAKTREGACDAKRLDVARKGGKGENKGRREEFGLECEGYAQGLEEEEERDRGSIKKKEGD